MVLNDINKKLKSGYTTGSAATASAKAALIMLITGEQIDSISVMLPTGDVYDTCIFGQIISGNGTHQVDVDTYASCYVVKESGDDPDITAGIKIYAKVSFCEELGVHITGGDGIGIVTRPGLDQPVGEYAINSTPRRMIEDELINVLDEYEIERGVNVEISAPEGREIAIKTFNPHMGIEGGISIIGTTGIVKPMSTEALIDTIKLDIKMQYSEGKDTCIIVPGNYGVTFLENKFHIDEKDIVLCSNFVGDSIRFAVDEGFTKILFCSHIGKLIKVSGGMMNTHSKYGDRRMELMNDAFNEVIKSYQGSDNNLESRASEISSKILNCVSTTGALDILNEIGLVKEVSEVIVSKAVKHLEDAANHKASIQCIMYENNYGELARNY